MTPPPCRHLRHRHSNRLFAAITLAALLAGCGQKGPLHLPQTPSAVPEKPAATSTSPTKQQGATATPDDVTKKN